MKRRFLTTLTLVLIGLAPVAAVAEALAVGADATLASVLAAQVGQRVFVQTASGELSGVVKAVGAQVAFAAEIASVVLFAIILTHARQRRFGAVRDQGIEKFKSAPQRHWRSYK